MPRVLAATESDITGIPRRGFVKDLKGRSHRPERDCRETQDFGSKKLHGFKLPNNKQVNIAVKSFGVR